MASREWILGKCDAYIEAWRRAFGDAPSFVNTALAVSVAWHETRCGDAWPGHDGLVNTEDDENNWGATTLRSLNAAEQWILATHAMKLLADADVGIRGDRLGFNSFKYSWQRYQLGNAFDIVQMQSALGLTPDGVFGSQSRAALEQWKSEYPGFPPEAMWPMVRERLPLNGEEAAVVRSVTPSVSNGHAAKAAEAMRVLRAGVEGTGVKLPQAVIHCDSTPKDGAYFVWFASFPTPIAGAEYFIKLLAGANRQKPAAAVLLHRGTPHELAEAMYRAGYYTGFFKADEIYPDGKTGRAKNIAAYAGRIQANYPTVLAALESRKALEPAADTEKDMQAMGDTERPPPESAA
jgi:hypothetical protein